MIERYSREEITKVWGAQNKFQKWLNVELAVCRAHAKKGNITKNILKEIEKKVKFDPKRISEIEAEVHHDVIAFLTNLAENIGEASRYVHLGLTSSDVVDTAFSLLIQDAGKILQQDIKKLLDVIKKQAQEHKKTLMMGRTHGVHAEPMTLGHKLAIWYAEMKRNQERLDKAMENLRVGKISGAVGNYAHLAPDVEALACKELGLDAAFASSQILQRDRHAEFLSSCAIIAGTLEKIALEIRSLQKTECNEILEPFSTKQKGSSAMPHKKNPILSERVCGCARVMRGYAMTALENQALWHERDISHSGAERIIFPDATILLDYMFSVMEKVLSGIVVNKEQMLENIGRSYNVFYSQQLLLLLVEKGITREAAYRIVQSNALSAFENKTDFKEKIKKDKRIKELLSEKELEKIFSLEKYSANTDYIFKRVFG